MKKLKSKQHKLYLKPKTKYGNISIYLIISFATFFILANIFVMAGQTGGETFFDNLYISIPMLAAGISAITSMVAGLIALFKQKERSLLVFLSTVIGIVITIFSIGELFVPH